MGKSADTNNLPVILIVSRYYLPGFRAGGPVRSVANLVDALKGKFQIKVVCSNRDHGSVAPYSGIHTNQWQKVNGVDVYYAPPAHFASDLYEKLYADVKPDVIYLNSFFDRWYSMLPVLKLRNKKTPIIIAPRGEFGDGALQQKRLSKRLYLMAVKILGFYKNVYWHASSEVEKKCVQVKINPKSSKLFCISNLPEIKNTKESELIDKDPAKLRIVLPARISAMKNTAAAIRIVNQLKFPVEFDLWGLNEDHTFWKQCQDEIIYSPGHVKVAYRGELAHEKLHDVLKKYDLMLMPTLGENFGHSIVEALAAGLPVVISDRTPWRNLEAKHIGYDLPLDQEAEFVRAITELQQMAPQDFHQVRMNCLKFVECWKNNSSDVEQYENV
jgi:glycosyltransferase involved in cell wall biosynthesis